MLLLASTPAPLRYIDVKAVKHLQATPLAHSQVKGSRTSNDLQKHAAMSRRTGNSFG